MQFKDLFDKEFIYESTKLEKKGSKIFYKFDIKIKKKEEDSAENTPAQSEAPAAQTPATEVPAQPEAAPAPEAPVAQTPVQPEAPAEVPEINLPLPSVVTEDEKVTINDDNNIVRQIEGEVLLSKEDINSIQTIEDIIIKLTEEKVEGVNILDEFTADMLQVIMDPVTQPQLKDKIDKESTIFAEILYGKKKENSVGVRVIKRKNSDLLTTSMIIDNKIINAKYNKDTIDKRITEYRNDEFETE